MAILRIEERTPLVPCRNTTLARAALALAAAVVYCQVALGGDVITRRFRSKRAQRRIRLQLFS
jgi:hypothetical protein